MDTSLSISDELLSWYDGHARILPWRVSPQDRREGIMPDPYRVWLSEIMLQQTTVATVKERYERFLQLWPELAGLAAAPVEEVLQEWAGLGYYARARNLHKCAGIVVGELNGKFPKTVDELILLPGIGPYTAAAIAAIAFDQSAAVMDGNVERVVARLFNVGDPLPRAKPLLFDLADKITPRKRPGDHAQAMMDLGATICTPRNPACGLCPLRASCEAYAKGCQSELPRKQKKVPKPTRYGAAFVIRRRIDDAVLLIRRPAKGLLGGMLAFPSTEWGGEPVKQPEFPIDSDWVRLNRKVKHTFTHFHLEMDIWETSSLDSENAGIDGQWVLEPESAGLPTVFRKVCAP